MLTNDELLALANAHAKQHGYAKANAGRVHAEPDGITFSFRTEGDEIRIGDGPFFIDRRFGEISCLGSNPMLCRAILKKLNAIYSQGLRSGYYRFSIIHVVRQDELASVVADSRAEYCNLELAAQTVWPNWKQYDESTVMQRLESLPCSFLIDAYGMSQILPELQALRDCSFDFTNIGERPSFDWRPESYERDEFGPRWA